MIGSLISAGTSLLGGILGNKKADKQSKMQKTFAQKGIRWRVNDAKAAGLHPLAALGAQTQSYQPVQTGDYGISEMGQNISRAMEHSQSPQQQQTAYTQALQKLQLKRGELENTKLASEIALMRQPGNPPTIPLNAGTVRPTPGVKIVPNEIGAAYSASPSTQAGTGTDRTFSRTKTGYAPMQSKFAKEGNEEDVLGSLAWNLRNRLMPTLFPQSNPPPFSPGKGKKWQWHPGMQEWRAIKPGQFFY